jgi:hypothetical protein
MMRYILTLLAGLVMTLNVSAQTKSAKRGICGDASQDDLAAFAPYVAWYYDWSVGPPAMTNGELSGIEWVPMQWGAVSAGQVATIEAAIPEGSIYLLGFNEPNFTTQANLTPTQAAGMWPYMDTIATHKGLVLVSPAVNWCGSCVAGVTNDPVDWLDKFIEACPDCRFDYIAIHNYNSYLSTLQWYIDKFRKYGKPIWLTEFAPWDDPVDYSGVVRYMKEAIPYLESEPVVFRYSWFATRVGSNPDLDLLDDNGELTKLGQLYSIMSFEGDTSTADVGPLALLPEVKNVNISAGQTSASVQMAGNTYDPDDDVISVEWSQVSGPAQAVFTDISVTNPVISGLLMGSWVFQMMATANEKSDSARITVNVSAANIAKFKPATASSTQNDYTASKANDGNLNTRWSSLDYDPQWIRIDLSGIYELRGAKIVWEAAYAKEYTIDVSSDGTDWTTVYSTTSGTGGTTDYTFSATARYIRMYSVKRNNQAQYWGNSIYEFEVYGNLMTAVGHHTLAGNADIRAYPNPCTDHLTLEFPETSGESRLTVLDCMAKTVYTENMDAGRQSITMDTGTLEPGLYIVRLTDGRKWYNKYLVKMQ